MQGPAIEAADSQKQTEKLPVIRDLPPTPTWAEGTERITERLILNGYAVVCDPSRDRT